MKLLLLLLLLSVQLQAQTNTARFSLTLMQWMHNEKHAPEKNRTVVAFKSNGTEYLSAFIKVSDVVNERDLNNLGVIIGTKAGNIWTVRIPKENIAAFSDLGGINYIDLDRPVRHQMDSARYYTHVDSVTRGIGLNLPYTGKGVVAGISDDGFDYTHPAFYDTTYTHCRIKRAWIQSINGTPPTGYSYGTELSDTASILDRKYDHINWGSHGNMVAGIMAGSGMGSKNNRFHRGVAYESDLVMISGQRTYLDWRALNMTTLIDGFNYTFQYAASQGKPAVINSSLGTSYGPHDGTSLFSQACDNLTGPGKILVFSAMNLGGTQSHLGKTFTTNDTTVKSLIPPLETDNGYHRNYIEIWGDTLQTFCLQFSLYKNGIVGNSTAVYCLDNSVKDLILIGSDNDTCFVTLSTKAQEYNKKPHAAFELYTKTKDTLLLSAFANGGTVHMWQEYFDTSWNGYYGVFAGNGTTLQEGDDALTIGEMGCTRSAITVGATVSRMYWKNVNNVTYYNPAYTRHGTIAPYSSKGPDTYGRMKPDITAPGGMIISSTNSYDSEFLPGGGMYPSLAVSKFVSPLNNRNYYYGAGQGTSFASPMVAGIVALMLQVNPNLASNRIKEILYATAMKDTFTTQNPNPAIWGAGKVNAYAAVKEVIRTVGVIAIPADEKEISLYPNPAIDKFTLAFQSESDGNYLVEILNLSGEVLQSKLWEIAAGNNQLPIQLESYDSGLYFISITGRGGTVTKRIVLK